MMQRQTKALLAILLLIVLVAPLALAGIGTSPSRWSFTFDEEGIWHAQGTHVSFSWNLDPLEVYDYMVDGVMVFDELSFPAAGSDYTTDGATFAVITDDDGIMLSFEDTQTGGIDVNCNGFKDASGAPAMCDLAFPKGSEIMVTPQGGHFMRLEVALPSKPGAIQPCVGVFVEETSVVEGEMIMFEGAAHAKLEPSMQQQPAPGNDHWTVGFDASEVWHATGQHVSFSWQLAPFEIYDLMVDGTMLIEELSFPADATDYMTEGATFKVMMGSMTLFSVQDNGVSGMDANCVISPRDPAAPPDPCDVEFPEGSEIMHMAAGGEHAKMSLFHVEYPSMDGVVNPCGTLGIQGKVSVEGSMAMFVGDMHLHYPVGQSMVG